MSIVIKPHSSNQKPLPASPSVFLAGSIENGVAEDWQKKVENELSKLNVTVYNPRNDDLDATLEQSITNKKFNAQVNWELDHLDAVDIAFFYFSPETKAPITLMELGSQIGSGPKRMIVCCPDGFWRKGNVEIFCDREGWPLYNDLDSAISALKKAIASRN
jgi:hypothetical protein